jgi:hypothetical protein
VMLVLRQTSGNRMPGNSSIDKQRQ